MESLVELARTLDDDSVRDVVEHLANRVEHKSPYVKRKALKVLKALVESGGGRVAKHVAKNASALRAAEQLTGAPHPSKGDSVNASVRAAAREVLAVTFARGGEPTSQRVPLGRTLMTSATSGATSGRANDDEDDDAYAFRTTPTKPTRREGVLEAPLEASLASTPKLNVSQGGTKWKPLRPPSPETSTRASTSGAAPAVSSTSAPMSAAATLDLLSDFAAGGAASATQTTSKDVVVGGGGGGGAFDVQRSEEIRAINALCTPSGVRLAPLDGDIERFLSDGATNYDARGVVTALAEKLVTYAGNDWKSAYRAACVLEYASRTRGAHGAWLVDVFANSSAMELLMSAATDASAQSQLRQKFTDTHAALSSVVASGHGTHAIPAPAPVPVTTAATPIDLLSQLGDLAVAAPPSTSAFDPFVTSSTATTTTSTAYPPAYQPPAQPMRGPGLAALDAIPPPSAEARAKSVPQFDFIKDLMK